MLRRLIPLSLLPLMALVQPAKADRLYWWQMTNPDGTAVSPGVYDDNYAPQDYPPERYAPQAYATPDERFNARQYQLYQREMARHYNEDADYGPNDGPYGPPPPGYMRPNEPPPYAAPVYPVKPYVKKAQTKPLHKKPVHPQTVATTPADSAPSMPATTGTTTPPLTPSAPTNLAGAKPAPQSTPKPVAATHGPVSCEKGATIVSSFGFEKVTTKACEASALAYNAERSGKPFEIDVNPKTGELTAVKKL